MYHKLGFSPHRVSKSGNLSGYAGIGFPAEGRRLRMKRCLITARLYSRYGFRAGEEL